MPKRKNTENDVTYVTFNTPNNQQNKMHSNICVFSTPNKKKTKCRMYCS